MSTPRNLFNSGIGPAAQITTVQNGCSGVTLPDQANWIDLPVGQNLKDHSIFTLTFNTKSNNTNSSSLLAADFTSPSQTNIDLFAQGNEPLVNLVKDWYSGQASRQTTERDISKEHA